MSELLTKFAAALPELDLAGAETVPITHGGSDRSYERIHLADGSSLILMRYTDARPDNLKFVAATQTLARLGVAVPQILFSDPDEKAVLLQDLGSEHLWDLRDAPWKRRGAAYKAALDQVAILHRTTAADLTEDERGALEPEFDEALYGWELDYFIEQFLSRFSRRSPTYVQSLRGDPSFADHVERLVELPRTLVHRDFQSQNVLITPGGVYLIDYQGLRLGVPEYDIASLLYDPYVEFTAAQRDELVRYAFRERGDSDWRPIFLRCAAQRLMQALGAYGRLGKELGKVEFLGYIPTALRNLREVLATGELLPRVAPYLEDAALSLTPAEG